jgi:hypothetical protein
MNQIIFVNHEECGAWIYGASQEGEASSRRYSGRGTQRMARTKDDDEED